MARRDAFPGVSFAAVPKPPPHSEREPSAASEKLGWLVRLRWIALALEAIAGVVGFRGFLLERSLAWPFFGVIATLLLFNAQAELRLRAGWRPSERDVFLQVFADAVGLTALLDLTGAIRNPFVPLLVVHAAIGAILLRGKWSAAFAGTLLACVGSLYAFRYVQVISAEVYVTEVVPLAALALAIAAVWTLTARLSRTLSDAEQRLFRAREREKRIDHLRALGALTAEFSHQFATPLNTIKMRAARLAKAHGTNGSAPDVEALSRAVAQCEAVLRQMAHAPLDTSMLGFKPIEIATFVKGIVEAWQPKDAAVPVRIAAPDSGERYCYVPAVPMTHAIIGLLDNAAQAGSGIAGIEIEIRRDADEARIDVMDRGPGWPDVVKRELGKPFVTTRTEGTGLGLYNCITLCEVADGAFTIADRPGGGAVATLVLPAREKAEGWRHA